jgi:hypothetical protein
MGRSSARKQASFIRGDGDMEDTPHHEGEHNESGMPGGGVGRRDETGKSGVYPVSASEGASEDAEVRSEAG